MVVGSPTKLNLIPSGVMPVVYINQGDAGYDKEFLIYNGDSPYNVPSGVSATIRGTKADGYGVTEAAALTEGSNLVTVTITEQMVAAAGENLYELVFVDTDGLRIATINMVWAVKADALGDSVISDSDLDYATTVMNTLQGVMAFKNQVDANRASIAAETAARIEADNTERAARIAADNTLQTNISAEATARMTQDAVLSARMDTFSSLPSGSTSGNAELLDIRVGANGTTYPSAGDAVRGQIGDLEDEIKSVQNIVTDFTYELNNGTADGSLDINLPKYTVISLHNNRSVNASAQLRNTNGDLLQNIGTITGNNTVTTTVNVDNVARVTGYCSGGYNVTLTVNNPNSHTNLINGLREDVDIIDNELFKKTAMIWEQGGIKVDTGAFLSITYRIRTSVTGAVSMVYAPAGMIYSIFAFDGDEYIGTFNGTGFEKDHNWMTGKNSFADLRNYPTYTFWLVGGYENNASVQPSVGSLIEVYYRAQQESVLYFSATPNIIFQARNVDDTKFPPESKWYIQAAAKNQYDRVRCTVRKTTDGYYFMCHDDNINNVARNLDGSVISEAVSASGKTLAQLNQYDWGIKYGSQYAGTTVPLLSEFLKYASIYNLGVTWHSATTDVETDASLAEQFDMIDKYGLTDNLIVITSNGHNLATMEKIFARNPRISYYIGGEPEYFADSNIVARIKGLQTAYNKIYVQLYPWGTTPSDSFISFAKSNNFVLYDSVSMSVSDLLNVNMFNKGYGLREINNVYNVKATVQNWADSLIDN